MVQPFFLVLLVLYVGRPRSVCGNQIRRLVLSEAMEHEVIKSSTDESYLESTGFSISIEDNYKASEIINIDQTPVFLDKKSKKSLFTDLLSEIERNGTVRNVKDIEIIRPTMSPASSYYLNINETVPQSQSNEAKVFYPKTSTNSTFENMHSEMGILLKNILTKKNASLQVQSTGRLQGIAYTLPFYYNEKSGNKKLKGNSIYDSLGDGATTMMPHIDNSNVTLNKSTLTPESHFPMQTPDLYKSSTIDITFSKSYSENFDFTDFDLKNEQYGNLVGNHQRISHSQNTSSDTGENIFERWRELEKEIKIRTDSLLKQALPKILAYKSSINVSSSCTSSILKLVTGLRNLKSWAIRMVDASGRFPSGSLSGTFTDLGDYDQCLDIIYPSSKKIRSKVRGQYCTLELKPQMPSLSDKINLYSHTLNFRNTPNDSVLSDISRASTLLYIMVLRIGVCVPSFCSENDIKQLTAVALNKIPVEVSVRNCEVKRQIKLSVTQMIILSFALLIFLLVATGTTTSHCFTSASLKSRKTSRLRLSIEAFSATENLQQLMEKSKRSSMLASTNGVRCLSLTWIVLAHTYGFGHRQGLARLINARQYMDDVAFQIITNAWVSVDTFFMLGGLLVTMPNLKTMEETNGKINFFHHIIHRIWRLTPPVVAVIGIMFLLPTIGSGPLWRDMIGQKVTNCEESWWQAILPINTWINFDNMCLLHTWYIAADLHFYFLSPILIISLYRWPTIGFIAILLMTISCAIISGLLTFFYKLPPTVIFFSPDVQLTKMTANLLYFRPYPHMGAYCVGIILGYALWKYKTIMINWPMQIIGWSLSAISCSAVLFATYPWNRNQIPTMATCIVYAMTHRTVWATGVAWVIFMCATGRGGILNQFLSSQLFVPLSKLSYSVYLLHFPVLWIRVSWRRTLLNFRHYDIVTEFFGILLITVMLSILFHIVFEAPFLKLEKIWFPRRIKKMKPEISDVQ